MMNEDPWAELQRPDQPDAVSARRVDSSLPWAFFWARDLEDSCLLVLRHTADSAPLGRLPQLKGLQTSMREVGQDGSRILALRLTDSASRELFYRLCLDIVSAASKAPTELDAVRTTLSRTWRWHHLLRGGGRSLLGPEEQQGLIGELTVLQTLILPHVHALDAVRSWRGPLGAPKDFEVGKVCVEAKARRGAATPYVSISSEYQLDASALDGLFLHVSELFQAQKESDGAFTLNDAATRCRESVAASDAGAVSLFEERLDAAGFRWEDDYGDMHWTIGRHHLFNVRPGFPALTPSACAPGVSGVHYAVSLADCEAFRVSIDDVVTALSGQTP